MNPLHINQQGRVVFVKEYPETEHTSSMQIKYVISVYGESGQHNAVLFPVFPTITNYLLLFVTGDDDAGRKSTTKPLTKAIFSGPGDARSAWCGV